MKVALFANTDWYLFNFRLSLAIALKQAGHEVILLSPAGDYAARFQSIGLRWKCVPMRRRSLNPLRELLVVWRLYLILKRERPSVIHSFTIKNSVYGSIAGILAGIPRVNSVAGLGFVFTSDAPLARILRPLVTLLLRRTLNGAKSRLIVQNRDDFRFFHENRLVDGEDIRLIYGSGVDCVRFSPTERKQPKERARVLIASRILQDKGFFEFVQMVDILCSRELKVDFVVAGETDDGNPAAIAQRTLDLWRQHPAIQWLGHVDDMPQLLRSVDVFVLPSYREGLPKSLLEAGACGVALVATDVPGCREVISNNVDGFLVPPRNATALAVAVERLILDRELREVFGARARVQIENMFRQDLVIERTMDVYSEVMSS
jgi:glycosyltransferase involved in cell wall biosynthesis